jgi:hypothetical protein
MPFLPPPNLKTMGLHDKMIMDEHSLKGLHMIRNIVMDTKDLKALINNWAITPVATQHWLSLNKPQVQKILPKIRIPDGRMVPKPA